MFIPVLFLLFGLLSNHAKGDLLGGMIKSTTEAVNFFIAEQNGPNFEVRLHKGVPGVNGTENIAGEATKKKFNLRKVGEGTVAFNSAAIEWVEVSTNEKYTYFTLWWGANFMGYGKIFNSKEEEGVSVEVGDTFKINIEALTVTVE